MPVPIVIPFGPFEPDSAIPNSGVVTSTTKVYPSKIGYTYIPLPASLGIGTNPTLPMTGGVVIQTSSSGACTYSAKPSGANGAKPFF